MRRRLPSVGVLLPCLLLAATLGCDQTAMVSTPTGPSPLNANVTVGASFGVEPSVLTPEVLPGGCSGGHTPFGVRLVVTMRGDHDIYIRGMHFSYTDRFGARALPSLMPIPSLSTPFPSGTMLPTSAPVEVPGFASFPEAGVLAPGGSRHAFPYLMRFNCGVVPGGTIIVVIETSDRQGKAEKSELRVAVARSS